MTKLSNITKSEEKLITHIFPELRNTLENYTHDHLDSKIAISVFDRWLGIDNLHLLDCKSIEERVERDTRMLCFWNSVFESTNVYTYESSSQQADSQKITFMHYVEKESYLEDCKSRPDKSSDQFQFIILPEFQAIYQESWDDTNIMWFVSRKKIEPLLEQVNACGLHVIEFEAHVD